VTSVELAKPPLQIKKFILHKAAETEVLTHTRFSLANSIFGIAKTAPCVRLMQWDGLMIPPPDRGRWCNSDQLLDGQRLMGKEPRSRSAILAINF
jgi:hypothetical protein